MQKNLRGLGTIQSAFVRTSGLLVIVEGKQTL